MFPSAETMRGITAPVLRDANRQLGSKADAYEIRTQKQRDGTAKPKAMALPLTDFDIRLRTLTSERAQEIFGLNSTVTMRGSMMRLMEMREGYVVEITAGDFEGKRLELVSVIERPLTDSYVLGLVDWDGKL